MLIFVLSFSALYGDEAENMPVPRSNKRDDKPIPFLESRSIKALSRNNFTQVLGKLSGNRFIQVQFKLFRTNFIQGVDFSYLSGICLDAVHGWGGVGWFHAVSLRLAKRFCTS